MIISTGHIKISNEGPLVYIGGPCVIEGEKAYLEAAKKIKAAADKAGVKFILKASFDKANRTSVSSYRGPGIEEGLRILAKAKALLKAPVLTDIHEPWQAEKAAKGADILQIPAFLCRQTDLLLAAGKTGLPVNIKKGQFMAPDGFAFGGRQNGQNRQRQKRPVPAAGEHRQYNQKNRKHRQ